ncbi:MAG: dihydroorotase, partial [Corynebacterium casei]|nr:dihydroorotase [Corynebacterium casei]
MTYYPETGRQAPSAAATTLLTNVRPYGEGEPVNVLIQNGEITAIGASAGADVDIAIDRTIDGAGRVLLPGLVD